MLHHQEYAQCNQGTFASKVPWPRPYYVVVGGLERGPAGEFGWCRARPKFHRPRGSLQTSKDEEEEVREGRGGEGSSPAGTSSSWQQGSPPGPANFGCSFYTDPSSNYQRLPSEGFTCLQIPTDSILLGYKRTIPRGASQPLSFLCKVCTVVVHFSSPHRPQPISSFQ